MTAASTLNVGKEIMKRAKGGVCPPPLPQGNSDGKKHCEERTSR